jgi:hypothetical protein
MGSKGASGMADQRERPLLDMLKKESGAYEDHVRKQLIDQGSKWEVVEIRIEIFLTAEATEK